MKYIANILILLVLGCASLEPDYVELGGGASQGGINNARNGYYDTNTEWLGVTLGWNLGTQARAMENLADLDVSKSGELTLRDNTARESSIIINNKKGEEKDAIPDQLAPTKTKEESYAFLLWAGGILVLAGAAVLLGKAGIKLPFFAQKTKE
jgi:hypothetical protein